MAGGAKAVLIGCSVVAVGTLAAAGVGGYYAWEWAKAKWKEETGSDTPGADLARLPRAFGDIQNTLGIEGSEFAAAADKLKKAYPFTPRPDGLVTEEQLRRYLAVCGAMESYVQLHRAEFEGPREGQPTQNVGDLLRYGQTRGRLSMEQMKAMEAQRMPIEEYHYVYTNVNADAYSESMQMVMKQMKNPQGDLPRPEPTGTDPQALEALDARLKDSSLSDDDRTKIGVLRTVFESGYGFPRGNQLLAARYWKELDRVQMYAMMGVKLARIYEEGQK